MYGLRKDMEGSQAYYDSLLALYAQWGVDYIKCDDICNTSIYQENQYSAAHGSKCSTRPLKMRPFHRSQSFSLALR